MASATNMTITMSIVWYSGTVTVGSDILEVSL